MYTSVIHGRDEREQRSSEVEYLSQAVRAKAEECLAAVDDGTALSVHIAFVCCVLDMSSTAMTVMCPVLLVLTYGDKHL